jgi:uncharacterized protein involved in response to NO
VTLGAALWSSGFRPFFLVGGVFGPLAIGLWMIAPPSPYWHAHEMVYGFSMAIVCGVLLTALPSWSGAADVRGGRLAMLVALWLLARAAILAGGALPAGVAAFLDCALVPALLAVVVPTLGGARWRLFVWTLPPLVALFAGNVFHYLALGRGDRQGALWGILLGVHGLAFLYSLYGGLLTPAFTRTWLRGRGVTTAAIHVPLEYVTAASMVAYAVADLAAAGPAWIAGTASFAFAVHVLRAARWQGWKTGAEPLLWTLHLGYLWFIAMFALRTVAELTDLVPREAWVHAFTLGALGLTMTGLMTRVVLRHTGRALVAPPIMRLAYFLALGAALLRLAYSVHDLGEWALALSALAWTAAILVYLARYGALLVRPSLPRVPAAAR